MLNSRTRPGRPNAAFHTTVAVSEETLRQVHELAWRYGIAGNAVVRILVAAATDDKDGRLELARLDL